MTQIKRKLPAFIIMVTVLLMISACSGEKTYEGDLELEIGDFSYENQDGEIVHKKDLDGSFWVADFIFTNCTSVCPPMTTNKSLLQDLLKEEGLEDVQLVSFSVDPERDTPEALKEYGEVRGIEFDNTHFLTGYEYEEIKDFSLDSFMSSLMEEPDTDQISHTVSFFIVAPNGKAITRFDGTQHTNMEKIVDYIKDAK